MLYEKSISPRSKNRPHCSAFIIDLAMASRSSGESGSPAGSNSPFIRYITGALTDRCTSEAFFSLACTRNVSMFMELPPVFRTWSWPCGGRRLSQPDEPHVEMQKCLSIPDGGHHAKRDERHKWHKLSDL